MVFHWSLSDSKSPQVSTTLLSILAVLNNAVVWMVSTCPPTSKSSSPFSNPLLTVPNAPITIGIIFTCMFHSFFQFSCKVEVLIIIIIIFSHRDFFTPVLTGGISMESEWQQVSSDLQDSSEYPHHHHHHVALSAGIFLNLSRHPSLSSIAIGSVYYLFNRPSFMFYLTWFFKRGNCCRIKINSFYAFSFLENSFFVLFKIEVFLLVWSGKTD